MAEKKPPKKNFMGLTKKQYFDQLAAKQKPVKGPGLTAKPVKKTPQKTAAQVQQTSKYPQRKAR